MKQHINKRIAVLMTFVFLMTVVPMPWSGPGPVTVQAHQPGPADSCRAAKRWKYLAASTAFVLGFTPFTPVAIIYGVVALAAEGYEAIYC